MKCFSTFVFVVISSTTWNAAIGASIGFPNSKHPPNSPASPQVDISLNASLLATTLGQVGVATADQQVLEHVEGDVHAPATIYSSSGISAEVNQNGEIDEVAFVNMEDSSSITVNHVTGQNVAAASSDELEAELSGGISASVEHSGESYSHGGGVLVMDANTSNNLENPKKGMKV